MQITELVAVVRANVTNFQAGMTRAAVALDGFQHKAGQLAASVDRMATRIGAVVGGLAAATTVATAKMGVDFLALKEKSLIAFETMLGGADKAKKMMADLTEFAAKTPFELPGLIDSTQKLLAYGVAAEKVLPMLRVIGDAAAGLGGGEKIDYITRAFGQMIAKSKISAQEMLQLSEQGVPAWQMLANVIGTDVPTAMKLAETGAIRTSDVLDGMLAQLDQKFGGLMDKQSRSWSGMWSTILDNTRQIAGYIFEPLFNAGKNVMASILGQMDGGAFAGVAAQLRNVVAQLSAMGSQWIITQGPAALRRGAQFLTQFAQAGMQVVNYLRQQGPALAATAQSWGAFLRPIFEYLGRHPELIAAFVALKTTGLLGINAVLKDSASLTLSAVSAFSQLAAGAGGLNTAMIALRGGGIALALAGIALLAKAIYDSEISIRQLRAELQRAKKLDDEIRSRRLKGNAKQLEVDESQPLVNQQSLLQERLALAQKNQAGASAALRGSEAKFNELNTTFRSATGNKLLADAKAEMEDMRQRADDANALVEALQDKLNAVNAKMRGEPSPGASPPDPHGATAGLPHLQSQAGAESAEKAAKDAAKAAESRQSRGAEDLQRFTLRLSDSVSDGTLAQRQAAQFWEQMRSLTKAFQDGKIAELEYEAQQHLLNRAMGDAVAITRERQNADAQATDSLHRVIDSLSELGPDGQFDQIITGVEDKFAALQEQLYKGALSVDDFKNATAELADEAERAAKAEQRKKLLAGDFAGAGLNFQQALEDKFAQARMQQFNQAVDNVFNRMTGLGNGIQQVATGFGNLNRNMQNFGQTLGRMPSQEDVARLSQQLVNTFSTLDGQLTLLQNNLALAQQRLRFADDYFQRAAAQADIDSIISQISALQNQPPPVFTPSPSSSTVDPALQPRGGGVVIHAYFPDVRNIDQSQIAELTRRIDSELSRQGVSG